MRTPLRMGLAFALAASTSWTLPPASAQTPTEENLPGPLREVGFEQRLGEHIPLDLVFTDERGENVQIGDYFTEGRPVVLALVYYECPMLCDMILSGLMTSLDVLTFTPGEDYEVVIVSFDPRERPLLAATKKVEYMRQFDRPGTEGGFHFLVGESPSIDALTAAVGFSYVYDADADEFAHASGITVLTPEGGLSRYLFGIEYAPKDLRLALVESAQMRIGSAVDQLLLFCYAYDPATGKYGAAAMNLLRLGGVLTVLTLLGFILLSRRRDRRFAQLSTEETRPS